MIMPQSTLALESAGGNFRGNVQTSLPANLHFKFHHNWEAFLASVTQLLKSHNATDYAAALLASVLHCASRDRDLTLQPLSSK